MADKKKSTTSTETSQQKLSRLAGKRVPKAVKAIAAVGNLKAYKPTPVQVKAIMSALNDAFVSLEKRLSSVETKSEAQFSLPT